ncbi:uncharacterized protein LOC143566192 [Bidens hawaiensis]|uniref:uncharacterized protein LOC143566192 n=1 Tax=Bidens hawaiensis TaxID=980011 RepID=UPI004049FFBE
MSWSCCPFCSLQLLSTELQRHANNHFEDQDLAFHISVGTSSRVVGLMNLLKNCLESESKNSTTTTTILSGYVDHFQSLNAQDVGWGCGWRNIQMLASHLLLQRPEQVRGLLFGGSGSVPDIPSLQRWLEVAWGKGFDAAGSLDFDQSIYGKRAWIGTTECAALFRSFGLRARIVDFCISDKPQPGASSSTSSGHQLLANWVWSYFSDNTSKSGVVVTEKSPLYFQHNGHSRTIVGIQLKSLPNGTRQYTLLILDPAHKTHVLESCLSKKVGWQRFIKRGVHTLKKTEYQLCYVDPGIATGAEMEKLKTLDSTRFEFQHV